MVLRKIDKCYNQVKSQVLWPRLKVGSSTVRIRIQIAASERLFEGLYLKIRTFLRAAQRAFLPTCQELVEAGEPVYFRNGATFSYSGPSLIQIAWDQSSSD